MIRVKNGHVTLVLANRQLVSGIVMLMLLMWLFALATYAIFKVSTPSPVVAEITLHDTRTVVPPPALQ